MGDTVREDVESTAGPVDATDPPETKGTKAAAPDGRPRLGFKLRRMVGLGPTVAERRLWSAINEQRERLKRLQEEDSVERERIRSLAAATSHDGRLRQQLDHTTDGNAPWIGAATRLLDDATAALRHGDTATTNVCLSAARREEVWGYGADEIASLAASLGEEARDNKLSSWRSAAITELLGRISVTNSRALTWFRSISDSPHVLDALQRLLQEDEPKGSRAQRLAAEIVRSGVDQRTADAIARLIDQTYAADPSIEVLASAIGGLLPGVVSDRVYLHDAMKIRDEGLQNTYVKIERLQQQLIVLGTILVTSVVGIVLMARFLPLSIGDKPTLTGRMAEYVALFGALGGSLSAVRSLTRPTAISGRIPQQLVAGTITYVRPLFGAAAALAVFALLESGVVKVQSNTVAAVLAVSFVAGFTERLVVSAAGALSGASGDGSK